jgi:hypothetical protein
MREQFATIISIVAIGGAVFQLVLLLWKRRSAQETHNLEVTIHPLDNDDDQTRSLTVAPGNIHSVESLIAEISHAAEREDVKQAPK